MTEGQGPQSPGDAVLAGQMVIIVEMIDTLGMFESEEVDIADFGCPFEVVVRRPDILVLCPAAIE